MTALREGFAHEETLAGDVLLGAFQESPSAGQAVCRAQNPKAKEGGTWSPTGH